LPGGLVDDDGGGGDDDNDATPFPLVIFLPATTTDSGASGGDGMDDEDGVASSFGRRSDGIPSAVKGATRIAHDFHVTTHGDRRWAASLWTIEVAPIISGKRKPRSLNEIERGRLVIMAAVHCRAAAFVVTTIN
jgi:hypothetical protein